ncbi:hypothetical protein L4C38_08295 [Vibrio kasasachensis]|uniref:hypothetical protein n=1 Tax=Vibrio kasasachensis TaxID=2910248 RepID=UPI003D14460D
MKNSASNQSSDTQAELKALRERLRQNSQTMQTSASKASSQELLSLVIKSTATFEKN